MKVLKRKANPIPKTEKNPKGAGRPTDYKPSYVKMAFRLALLGATKVEMADAFGVCEYTIYEWLKKVPEFAQAVKDGGIKADSEVVEALFKRAKGYKHKDINLNVVDKRLVKTELTKHYPPDTQAAHLWLRCRRAAAYREIEQEESEKEPTKTPVKRTPAKPIVWNDKTEVEVSGPGGTPLGAISNMDERARQTREAMLKELQSSETEE